MVAEVNAVALCQVNEQCRAGVCIHEFDIPSCFLWQSLVACYAQVLWPSQDLTTWILLWPAGSTSERLVN